MRWEQGSASIDRMLADAELQRVPASRDQADSLLAQARIHLTSAASICADDPPGAYALAHDAARKALTAVLANQGLRPTTRGVHLAAYDAVRAQLDPPPGKILRPFDRMRRQRHDAEYPPVTILTRRHATEQQRQPISRLDPADSRNGSGNCRSPGNQRPGPAWRGSPQ
jgi:hypothetical protein